MRLEYLISSCKPLILKRYTVSSVGGFIFLVAIVDKERAVRFIGTWRKYIVSAKHLISNLGECVIEVIYLPN